MRMAIAIFAVHIVTWGCVLVTSVWSADSGCSFVGGQCLYTVQLGHSDQCDQTQYSALSSQYSALRREMDGLKAQVQTLSASKLNDTQTSDTQTNDTQTADTHKTDGNGGDDMAAILSRTETERDTAKADLAKASAEIQNLREKLARTQNFLGSCQAAVETAGIPWKATNQSITPDPTDGQTGGHTHLTYISFNEDEPGFTFTKTEGGAHIKKMHSGSSDLTGPRVEHSWGVKTGSYLGLNPIDVARSVSFGDHSVKTLSAVVNASFPPASGYCVKFWTFMKGKDVGQLTMTLKLRDKPAFPVDTSTGIEGRLSGPSGSDQWQLVTVEMTREYSAHEFQIGFTMTSTAHRGWTNQLVSEQGDIAVDDVYVYNTTCSSIPRHPAGAYSHAVNNVTSFYTFHATPLKWTDAYATCRRAGPWSALVSIETDEEQAFLVSTIQQDVALSAIGQNGFYTSGSDVDDQQNFVWTSTGVGQPVAMNTPHWYPGQPNNLYGDQNCLLMEYPTAGYQWGDVECNTEHPFICEVRVDSGAQA